MCDSRKFGSPWNRHSMSEVYRGHRICTTCGRTESWMEDSQGGSWTWEPSFDAWEKSLEEIRHWDEYQYPFDERKALNWFYSLGGLKNS